MRVWQPKGEKGEITAAGLDLLLFPPLISQIKLEILNQYDKKNYDDDFWFCVELKIHSQYTILLYYKKKRTRIRVSLDHKIVRFNTKLLLLKSIHTGLANCSFGIHTLHVVIFTVFLHSL